MLIDLQLHSTYSDGYLTPTEAAKFLSKNNVKFASLTDHNTVGGTLEFKNACKTHGIKTIPGIELYVKLGNRKMNILWYNFDYTNPELHEVLRDSQKRRRKLMRAALMRMKKKKFTFDSDKLLDKFTHYIPINHVIDEILSDKKNVIKIKKDLGLMEVREIDVINNYLRDKKVGKLANSFINIDRIFKLRKKIGGQIILCHPAKHRFIQPDTWKKLKKMGLDGVELLSPHHSIGAVMYIQFLARNMDLVETGGSDFHLHEGDSAPIQNSWDYYKIESKFLRGIEKIIG